MTGTDCDFCRMPAKRIVRENDLAITVEDAFPVVPGHHLVIVKRHISSIFSATKEELESLFRLVSELRKSFPERQDSNIGINDGVAAGQTVRHLHVHFIPRVVGDCEDPRGGIRGIFPARADWRKEMEEIWLPEIAGLNVLAFSRVLDKTTASYKFLWTLALIEIVEKGHSDAQGIPICDIVRVMLKLAEKPVNRFKLSLGFSDKISDHLSALASSPCPGLDAMEVKVFRGLSRYVPERWLSPFFEREISSWPTSNRNEKIRQLANERFHSEKPPYRFSENRERIFIHKEWAHYFKDNAFIIREWALRRWESFLQKKNPGVGEIIRKIRPF